MSLQDFFLKPSEEILKNKHHKDYPYNFFPEIKIEITPKQFILLDQKELSLFFKYESNGIFKFSFDKSIKKPFSSLHKLVIYQFKVFIFYDRSPTKSDIIIMKFRDMPFVAFEHSKFCKLS